ncbi:glycosyltransferase family 2 protein [Aureicoccus marinus]|uniref:dTDP-Rha--alpha-D-GlcNAc-pyrophosphate polyprenol alpha-3-L-rhamnosyltransferase n=1 Tax=Aureicoccus marinus TaxID=754435 RepID=A0A2S7T5W3_9FLAO|nr:glycosyltransferase family 2 protein [Aureicoccus marinus]PQJ14961.1 dTDP-Rha--alpha-D-GlcNAc-pyrophosphate polyprenol alpha-3-L-rhamnosyltransferase [Aureicoccus marinus]
MKVALVILNYNGASLLSKYLPSVLAHSQGTEVWVIDNASTDDSARVLEEEFPQVNVLFNSENNGYAGGYNWGLTQIEADVYGLLNSDLQVTSGWLEPLAYMMKENPEISIVQPKIKDLKKPEYFEYAGAAGGFLDRLGYPFCRGRVFQSIETDLGQYNDTIPVFWATGACFLVRSSVFHELGGFDADYFAHQEEIDFCWRAQNQGHQVWYNGQSEVFHLGGSTLSNMNPRKTFLNFRNSLFTLLKNTAKPEVFALLFARMVLDGIAAVVFLLQRKPAHSWAVFRAHLAFYQSCRSMWAKRGKSQKSVKFYRTTSIVWLHYVQQIREYRGLVKD